FAIHYLATKKLTRGDSAFLILFYTNVMQALMATVLVLGAPKIPSPATAFWVAALTIFGLFAHYALTRAFALADAIIVAPLDFLRLPLAAAVGIIMYGEPLTTSLAAGALVIVAANALNIWGERRGRSLAQTEMPTAQQPRPLPLKTRSDEA
ncbi:MAG: hypothetical protein ACK5JT_20275, partial [Hyphomicrobiaceae bacterium]